MIQKTTDHDRTIEDIHRTRERILVLSGSFRHVLPAVQARRADTSTAGRRKPPETGERVAFKA